jgi:LCP family protein required for cell wall assembly
MTHYTRVPLRNGRRNRRPPEVPRWLLATLLGLFVLATLFSAYLVFATVRDVVASWRVTNEGAATPQAGTGGGAVETQGAGGGFVPPTEVPQVGPPPTVAAQSWTGTDRVTVLVLGIDRRAGEDEKGYLTDTMLLVTMDPAGRTAAMLSIPRDLWVEVPDGFGVDTINTANRTGDYYDYPGGGPALAVKTVQHNLGVTVNYYVRLDFTAFETFVDTIGGIDVYNEETIDDPLYPNGSYGYEPFYLPAGQHHLNGHDALRYARTRHGATDIDRARRQQQVVMAVRERVLSFDMLPTLITQAPLLYQTLNDSVWTDLTLEQMVSLALLAKDIPRENIRSAVIDYQYVLDYQTPEGRQVLVPLRDKIRVLRDELFGSTAATRPDTTQDEPALIAAEAAHVQVLNGAGVDGLACATEDWLVGQGILAADCDTADRPDYASTVIVDYTGKPYTVRWLQRTFGVQTIISGTDPESAVDVKVIVGRDWAVP